MNVRKTGSNDNGNIENLEQSLGGLIPSLRMGFAMRSAISGVTLSARLVSN